MAKKTPKTLADLGDDPTKEDLAALASDLDIDGRSSMDKDQLRAAIAAAETPAPEVGQTIRTVRDATVAWGPTPKGIPVPAGRSFRVVQDPTPDDPKRKLAPVGLLSQTVRLSVAKSLHADGSAVVA